MQFSSLDSNIWGVKLAYNTLLLIIGISMYCSGIFICWQLATKGNYKLQNKITLFDNKISLDIGIKIKNTCLILGFLIVGYSNIYLTPFFILLYFLLAMEIKISSIKSNFWRLLILSFFLLLAGLVHNFPIHGLFDIKSFTFNLIPFLLIQICVITIIDNNYKNLNFNKYTGKNLIVLFLLFFSLLIGLFNQDPVSSTASITIIPFIIMIVVRNTEIDQLRAVRYSTLIMSVFIYTTYYQLIGPSIIIYYISKYFYWHRFDFHYPKLVLENDRNYT